MSPILVRSIFRKHILERTARHMLREICERGELIMKSDSHIVCVVFRIDSVSYSDSILKVSVLNP